MHLLQPALRPVRGPPLTRALDTPLKLETVTSSSAVSTRLNIMNSSARVHSSTAGAVAAATGAALLPLGQGTTVHDTMRRAPATNASTSNSLAREFCASGISVGCANVFLNPVEVVKTRMMLAARARNAAAAATTSSSAVLTPASAYGAAGNFTLQRLVSTSTATSSSAAASSRCLESCQPRLGFVGTARHILATEGPSAFARGVQAAAARAVLNGGIRLGLYNPIKDALSSNSSGNGGKLGMGAKLAAGLCSGAIGAATTSPLELIKTRLQAPNPEHSTARAIVRHMYGQYGLPGLWKGCSPGVLRVMLLNGFMVATYDEVKTNVTHHTGLSSSGLAATLLSSCISGVVTTTAINPVDVVRSYIQTGRGHGSWAVAGRILQQEGPGAFLKGWTAAYARTGPQTVIIFAVAEVVRPMFGLKAIAG